MKRVNRYLNHHIGIQRIFIEIWEEMDEDAREELVKYIQQFGEARLKEELKTAIYSSIRNQE